jgi:hypothetical protein
MRHQGETEITYASLEFTKYGDGILRESINCFVCSTLLPAIRLRHSFLEIEP